MKMYMLGHLHMIGFRIVCTGVMIGMYLILCYRKFKICVVILRDNRIGKLNEVSGIVEYVANTSGPPRGIAVDPFNRCVVYSPCIYVVEFLLHL